jgi:hypothetical protein
MWSVLGLGCAIGLAVLALVRSRRAGGFYDSDVYAMTPVAHRAYATASLGFGAVFCATLVLHADGVAIIALAAFTLLAVFYLTSFLRGFSDDQE